MNENSSSFYVISPIHVRFADIDVMGHVNNAVYLSYFEEARMAFFKELIGDKWNWVDHGILVARNEINYKVPVLLNDQPKIKTWCSRIGTTSLTINYEIILSGTDGESIASTGSTVIVCYDYSKKRIAEVPAEWRIKLLPTSA